MATKDRSALQIQAAEIKNETTQGANTANRIGLMLEDIIDSNQNRVSDLIPELQTQTGSTIVFTAYNEYNAASPLTSGDITIDSTNAVAGAYASVYYNGATEPTISGATVQLQSGSFASGKLNIYHFFWNTNGQAVLTIQNTGLEKLITPIVVAQGGDTIVDLTFSSIDSNATSNVLDRSLDDINYTNVAGYDGTSLSYQDAGLTNGTEYFYRLKSVASGFLDSNYGKDSATPAVSGNYLLDLYPADTAYSLRKLRTGAQYACQVQRLSDNATCDIVLENSGSISLSSSIENLSGGSGSDLGTWLGSNTAVINTWYDQSGNNKNATQATLANRPELTNASGVIHTSNGLPAISFTQADFEYLEFTESMSAGGDANIFSTVSPTTTGATGFWGDVSGPGVLLQWVTAGGDNNFRANDGADQTSSAAGLAITGQQLLEARIVSGGNLLQNRNGAALGAPAAFGNLTAFNNRQIGIGTYDVALPTLSKCLEGFMQEWILYKSDQSANQVNIETNINNFYTIY